MWAPNVAWLPLHPAIYRATTGLQRHSDHQQGRDDRLLRIGVGTEVPRRERLRLARKLPAKVMVAPNSPGTSPRQHGTGHDHGRANGVMHETVPRAGARRARRLVVADVRLAQRPRPSPRERHGDEGLGDHDTGRGGGASDQQSSHWPRRLDDRAKSNATPPTTGWRHHRQRAQCADDER